MRALMLAVSLAISLALVAPAVHAADAQAIVSDIRTKKGRSAIARSGKLDAVAKRHSQAMAKKGRMSHSVGGSFGRRMKRAGIRGAAAENIAYGQPNTASVIKAWMRSRGHRRNILDKRMKRFGMASAADKRGRLYWTMVLAR